MKIKSIFILFLFLMSCSKSEINLQTTYQLGFRPGDGEIYSTSQSQIQKIKNDSLKFHFKQIYPESIIFDSLSEIRNFIYRRIEIKDEINQIGEIELMYQPTIKNINYKLLDDVLDVQIASQNQNIYFKLEDNGALVESCRYLMIEFNSSNKLFKILDITNCEEYDFDEISQIFFNQNSIANDTVGIFKLHQSSI